jgi:pimeloyl-ACP methyl ester carboxylesterase
MNENRMHRAVSADGTEIVGTVRGQGPPLILQHGAMDHGEVSWGSALPYLTHRYTWHVPSLRNRGRSGHSDDSTPPRLLEDLTAYVASLGRPVSLVGLSLGGALALEAAHRIDQVTAVVAYEPAITAVIDEETRGRLAETVMNEEARAVLQGRLADGVRRFGQFVGNDEEVLQAAPQEQGECADDGARPFDGRRPPGTSATPARGAHRCRTGLAGRTDRPPRHVADRTRLHLGGRQSHQPRAPLRVVPATLRGGRTPADQTARRAAFLRLRRVGQRDRMARGEGHQ